MSAWLRNHRAEWPKNIVDHKIVEHVEALIVAERMAKSGQNEQHDYDFTEKLWDVLKECQSGETLARAFQIIFDKLCTGDLAVMVFFILMSFFILKV